MSLRSRVLDKEVPFNLALYPIFTLNGRTFIYLKPHVFLCLALPNIFHPEDKFKNVIQEACTVIND